MIDFRYHLVSLVSVFLALAVGIVLGAGPLKDPISDGLTRPGEAAAPTRTLRVQVKRPRRPANRDERSSPTRSRPQLVAGSARGARRGVPQPAGGGRRRARPPSLPSPRPARGPAVDLQTPERTGVPVRPVTIAIADLRKSASGSQAPLSARAGRRPRHRRPAGTAAVCLGHDRRRGARPRPGQRPRRRPPSVRTRPPALSSTAWRAPASSTSTATSPGAPTRS